MDRKISATSPAAFEQWRARDADDLTSEQKTDVDAAVQEVKFSIMAEGISGSDAIADAFRERVDGKTVRQLIQLGYNEKLRRLNQQQAEIEKFLAENAQLQTKSGDSASADYLAQRRDRQTAQRDAIARDITSTRARMAELGLKEEALPPLAPKTQPAEKSPTKTEEPDSGPQLIHK